MCAMERVLDVYKRPYDPQYPVVCMDETSKQCVKEVRSPQAMTSRHPVRYDAEYERNGVAHLILFYLITPEPQQVLIVYKAWVAFSPPHSRAVESYLQA